jgi:hypothetical protein
MNEHGPLDDARINRRRLLQAAVMGGAGAVAFGTGPVAAAARTMGKEATESQGVDAFEGLLAGVAAGSLEIQVNGSLRTAVLTQDTTFWKGGETSLGALNGGDDVLVRVRGGLVERAWSNLTRVQGQVLYGAGNAFTIEGSGHLHGPAGTYGVAVGAYTRFDDFYSGKTEGAPRDLPSGSIIDVIGLIEDGEIRASVVSWAAPDVKAPKLLSRGADQTRRLAGVSRAQCTTYTYNGFATWFTCGTGAGRCGTCDTGRSDQCAWPALDSSCSCCGGGCCNCSTNCKGQAYAWCGKAISISDSCVSQGRSVYIADCGPCQNGSCGYCSSLCSRSCSRCSSRQTPVIDLTKPTFAAFWDPAVYGCFLCSVQNTVC